MVLLDTHTLIWFMFDDSKLSETALQTIKTEDKVFVSIASLWELSIKQSLGKIDLAYSVKEISEKCGNANILILPIEPDHLDCIKTLPDIHKDPFDRLLIAQATAEGMALVTKDTIIPNYGIKTIW